MPIRAAITTIAFAERSGAIDRGNIQIGDERGGTAGHVNPISLRAGTASGRLVKTEFEQLAVNETGSEERQGGRDWADQVRLRCVRMDSRRLGDLVDFPAFL